MAEDRREVARVMVQTHGSVHALAYAIRDIAFIIDDIARHLACKESVERKMDFVRDIASSVDFDEYRKNQEKEEADGK